MCDGGGGVLGHPKVYMAIDHTGRVACSYCGRLFVRNPERAGQCEIVSPSDAIGARSERARLRHGIEEQSRAAEPPVRAQRLENWKLRRALRLPYFLRSTLRESRVNPPALRAAGAWDRRRPGRG